jgi:inhibitor of cysteine peptidase
MIRRFVLALALAAAACAPQPSQETTATPSPSNTSANSGLRPPTPSDVTVHINAAQNGQSVHVGVNQRFAVELVGVPTAGYEWAPTQIPAFLTRAGDATGNTVAQQNQPGFVGGNHWEVLMFAATGPGSGELVLEQRRPWETNQPANQVFRVTIVAE